MKGIIVNLIIGVMTARMDNFVPVIVQNVWSTFIIQVMQKLMRQKGNMTVHTWRISIFKENKNLFDLSPLKDYNPFNTCASAQMLIRKD